jgi:hypothetical protein
MQLLLSAVCSWLSLLTSWKLYCCCLMLVLQVRTALLSPDDSFVISRLLYLLFTSFTAGLPTVRVPQWQCTLSRHIAAAALLRCCCAAAALLLLLLLQSLRY